VASHGPSIKTHSRGWPLSNLRRRASSPQSWAGCAGLGDPRRPLPPLTPQHRPHTARSTPPGLLLQGKGRRCSASGNPRCFAWSQDCRHEFQAELGKSDKCLCWPHSRMFGSARCDCSFDDASCGRRCSNMPSRVADTCLVSGLKVSHPANLAGLVKTASKTAPKNAGMPNERPTLGFPRSAARHQLQAVGAAVWQIGCPSCRCRMQSNPTSKEIEHDSDKADERARARRLICTPPFRLKAGLP